MASATVSLMAALALLPACVIADDSAPGPVRRTQAVTKQQLAAVSFLRKGIGRYRQEAWRWQKLMRIKPTRSADSERGTFSITYHKWVRQLWMKRAEAAYQRALNPPHKKQWLCIHRYERDPKQGWRTRTGNGYYGGLQMDIDFQRSYGPELLRRKGTANNWSDVEQMWVAERAHRSGRGFHPWPNTARYCGLI